jgi:hypothetical protein
LVELEVADLSRASFLEFATEVVEAKKLYFTIQRKAEKPSRQPIFFPSL